MFQNAMDYWSRHVLLSNTSHAFGGFGLAIVLQHYLRGKAGGKPFVPVIIGWLLLVFCVLTHIVAFAS